MTEPRTAIVEALEGIVDALKAEGISVYYLPSDRLKGAGWVVIERNGNVGTVEYDRFDGYSVGFSIKPNRKTGSTLAVEVPGEERNPETLGEVLTCAKLATGSRHRNFATTAPLPNHGWGHFAWTKDRLVKL